MQPDTRKTIFVIGFFPDKSRTFLDALAGKFRVIMLRSQYFACDKNNSFEFAEDLLEFGAVPFDMKTFSWQMLELTRFSQKQIAECLQQNQPLELDNQDYNTLYDKTFHMSYLAAYFQQLHQIINIDLVISNADCSAIRRCVVLRAKQMGIPTIDIEHGFNYSLMPDPELLQTDCVPYPMFISDYVNLDNNLEVEKWQAYYKYAKQESPPMFVANGTPNDISSDILLSKRQARQLLNLATDDFTITLIGSWNEPRDVSVALEGMLNEVKFYQTVFRVLANLHNQHRLQVIIKLHPTYSSQTLFSGSQAYLQRLGQQIGLEPVLITCGNLSEILSASDLLICASDSSVVWEGFTVGVPGIILPAISMLQNFYPRDQLNQSNVLAKGGWVRYVHDEKTLKAALQHYLQPETTGILQQSAQKIRKKYEVKFASVHEKTEGIIAWISQLLGCENINRTASQVESLYEEGKQLVETGSVRKGLTILSNVLEICPNHRQTLNLMAAMYKKMGAPEKAKEMLKLINVESNAEGWCAGRTSAAPVSTIRTDSSVTIISPDVEKSVGEFNKSGIRNLIYQVCPFESNEEWSDNIDMLLHYWSTFNNKKIITIKTGDDLLAPDIVKEKFSFDPTVVFLLFANDEEFHEVHGFLEALEMVSSLTEDVTFYAHTKGVSPLHPAEALPQIRRWRNAMYRYNLFDPERIDLILEKYPCCGCFKKYGAHHLSTGVDWHFSGTFFWFKNQALFANSNWQQIPKDRYAVESYLAGFFQRDEAFCLFADNPSANIYHYSRKDWDDLYHDEFARLKHFN